MLANMMSHHQKCHVAHDFKNLVLMNAMIPLTAPLHALSLDSQNDVQHTSVMAPHEQDIILHIISFMLCHKYTGAKDDAVGIMLTQY